MPTKNRSPALKSQRLSRSQSLVEPGGETRAPCQGVYFAAPKTANARFSTDAKPPRIDS